ncbi:MAG: hypothetical protein ACR2J8_03835, partial [Thermomicrobiales bacterium]
QFRMTVTDLALREWLDAGERSGTDPHRVGEGLKSSLYRADVWLRVGFARPWAKSGDAAPVCYTQINGLHTVPDYLGGWCYGDFAPVPAAMLQNPGLPPAGAPMPPPGAPPARPSFDRRPAEFGPDDIDDIPF